MNFYLLFSGSNRQKLTEEFGADPFSVPTEELLERILASGYVPDVASIQTVPFAMHGAVHEVRDYDDREFLLGVDPVGECIVVQEMVTARREIA